MRQRTAVRKIRHLTVLAVLLASALVAGGCRQPAIGTDVVVTIDGEGISYSEFESYLRDNVDASYLPLESAVLDELFDQFLDERLLVRLAAERGFDSETAALVDQRTAVTYLLRQADLEPWSEAEIAAHYQAHKQDYQQPESVRLRQILVYERQDADAVQQALAGGEDFTQVAARFSQVPMVDLGDGAGRLTREDLPEAFVDSIFELEPGEISETFAADYGFHIFQIVERFPAQEVPLAEVAGEIRRILDRQRHDELVARFISAARERYNVRIHTSNFPFDYRGSYAHKDSM